MRIITVFCLLMIAMTHAVAGQDVVLHEEFCGFLFQHLEILPREQVLSGIEVVRALEDLNFQPDGGYTMGKALLYGEMAVVLIRVYQLEMAMGGPGNYTLVEAIERLVQEGILDEQREPDLPVDPRLVTSIIGQIPSTPGYRPRYILLPRVPPGQPYSHFE
ncbi:MAG TPA: hypothetical protein PLV45_12170 [bacterium]|nr:hypothetical protein [bacterium]